MGGCIARLMDTGRAATVACRGRARSQAKFPCGVPARAGSGAALWGGQLSSKDFLNRSKAASKAGRGGARVGRSARAVLISPIITLSASRLLLLGELVSRAAGSP